MSGAGVLVGLGAGAGLLLVASGAASWRAPRLVDRLDRHARPRPAARAAGHAPGAWATLAALAASVRADATGRRAEADLARRLERAGAGLSVERYRLQQLAAGCAGLAAGVVLASAALLRGAGAGLPALLAVCAFAAAAGVLLRDRALTVQVRRRQARIAAQLPGLAELLALAVAAGESPAAGLERVARTLGGELAAEVAGCLAHVRAGTPFVRALREWADRLAVPVVTRFVDGVATAVDRGTPMADVLRAQAADARSAARRALLDTAGRREVAMMVPVVFLVLPAVVVVALFPGVVALSLTGL